MKSRSIINLTRGVEKYKIASSPWEVPFPKEYGLVMRLRYPGNTCDSATATPGK